MFLIHCLFLVVSGVHVHLAVIVEQANILAPFGLEHVVCRKFLIRCGAQYVRINLFSPFISSLDLTDQVL